MRNILQVFRPAVLTDLNVKYQINKQVSFSFTTNNIFNLLPKWDLVAINSTGDEYLKNKQNSDFLRGMVSFRGRYSILGASGSQFSQLGTTIQSSLVFKF